MTKIEAATDIRHFHAILICGIAFQNVLAYIVILNENETAIGKSGAYV